MAEKHINDEDIQPIDNDIHHKSEILVQYYVQLLQSEFL